MKFIITSWQDEFIHYDRDTGNLLALSKIIENSNIMPLFIDNNGLILNIDNISLNHIKIQRHGDYISIFHIKENLYYSARRNGIIRPWQTQWNKWEQFFIKSYDLYKNIDKIALENLNIKKIQFYNNKRKNQIIPKIIWMFWDGETTPNIVKSCFNNTKRLNPNYDIRICNFENLNQYVDIKFNKEIELSIAMKSDLIRLTLLSKYGGVWLDASTLLMNSLDTMFNSIENYSQNDCIAFYAEKFNSDNLPVIESWFLAAPPNSKFIKTWLRAFKPVVNLGATKYIKKLSKRDDYSVIVEKITNPEYLAVYVAAIITLKKMRDTSNITLWNAYFSAFSLQYQFHWDQSFIINALCKTDLNFFNFPKTPILKVTNTSRKILNQIIENNELRENSFLFKFIKLNNIKEESKP